LNAFQGILLPSIVTGDSDLESSRVYTVPPCFFESLPGRPNRSLPSLPLHMHAEEIIATFSTLNIYIGLYLPDALTLALLWLYKLFRTNRSVGRGGNLSFRLRREVFLHRLARGIPLKEGGPYPLQCEVRTPPPHLR
jgi:hypothetical protein